MDDKVWYPRPEKSHSYFFPSESLGPWETSTEAQGLSVVRVEIMAENFSLCTENRYAAGLLLGDTPR